MKDPLSHLPTSSTSRKRSASVLPTACSTYWARVQMEFGSRPLRQGQKMWYFKTPAPRPVAHVNKGFGTTRVQDALKSNVSIRKALGKDNREHALRSYTSYVIPALPRAQNSNQKSCCIAKEWANLHPRSLPRTSLTLRAQGKARRVTWLIQTAFATPAASFAACITFYIAQT